MRVMSFKAVLALGVIALTPAMAQANSAGGHYSVELNKTQVVYLPSSASAVVIGNPEIADVSIHSANTIFVVGRGYGETNLVVLDTAGQKIMDTNIQVLNNLAAHGVRLYNGKSRETYSCVPYCQPAPVLGDSQAFLGAHESNSDPITNDLAAASPSQSASSRTQGSFSSQSSPELSGLPNNTPPPGF